ncbi:MAG: glycosyltransferase [Paludibacteraceae bacterium]|nr:glycosyltransferase [Paludibacteraceae bacterium]
MLTIGTYILSPLDCCLIAAAALLLVYQVVFLARYIGAVPRALRRSRLAKADAETSPDTDTRPGVSVIICARNEGDNIRDYLHAVLTQDYPLFEVIVVNDRSQDDTREAVEWYMVRDRRVRMTFVPMDARVGSSKKLALTLGAKSAHYDILLLTDADCRPDSPQWISRMVAPFANPDTQIVLGYGAYYHTRDAVNALVRYDTLFNGLHYLGAALTRRPYMGVGRNLAYRKPFFFSTGGFTTMMQILAGDDDLFVNHNANRRNTVAVVLPDSITWSVPKRTLTEWLQQKRRHLGVSPHYRFATRLHLAFEPFTRGLLYALPVACFVLWYMGLASVWTLLAAAVAWLIRMLLLIVLIQVAHYRLHRSCACLWTPWHDMILPLISLYMLLTAPLHRHKTRW